MAEPLHISFQQSAAQLLTHELGRRLLAFATPAQLVQLAQEVVAADLYHFPSVIKATAQFLPLDIDPETLTLHHLEHLLWVEHRRACWSLGHIRSAQTLGCSLRIEGQENLDITRGSPTVILTPMMLPSEDALWVVRTLLAERELVIYAEDQLDAARLSQLSAGLDLCNVRIVGNSLFAARQILTVLNKQGCFLTYPDFVYTTHKVHPISLFGIRWPLSAGFLSICSRPGTVLLPCYIKREDNELLICIEQPVQFTLPEGAALDQRWAAQVVGTIVAKLLETLILGNAAQWLLLSTIVAECQQRAKI